MKIDKMTKLIIFYPQYIVLNDDCNDLKETPVEKY